MPEPVLFGRDFLDILAMVTRPPGTFPERCAEAL